MVSIVRHTIESETLLQVEHSATYIDSPIQYNSYNGLPYYRLFANGSNYTETLNKDTPIFGTTYEAFYIIAICVPDAQ